MPKNSSDIFNLTRFIHSQNKIYDRVLNELKSGKKKSHWIWFIFPQIEGLGTSTRSRYFAIKSVEERDAYLAHPVLSKRLLECVEIIYLHNHFSISEIFGEVESKKFWSSMILFASHSQDNLFKQIIEKYYQGKYDTKTIQIVKSLEQNMDMNHSAERAKDYLINHLTVEPEGDISSVRIFYSFNNDDFDLFSFSLLGGRDPCKNYIAVHKQTGDVRVFTPDYDNMLIEC